MPIENITAQSGKGFYDIALALYDKNPLLVGTILLIMAITPIILGWLSFLKKQEDTKLSKFVHINNKKKSRKKRRKR